MSHGRAARFGALPSPSHHQNTNEPAVLRRGLHETRRHIGGGAALGKTRRERPAGDGGALRSEG